MIVLICILKLNNCSIWLDLSNIKEHFVDLLVVVGVGSTKVIALPDGFFHLQAVNNTKCNISYINWLYLCIHTVNLPIHSVEHLHLHAPLCRYSWILMKQINHVSGPHNRHIRTDRFNFLFTNPFSSKSNARRIRISSCSTNIDKSLDVVRVLDCLCNGDGNIDVSIFKVLLLLHVNFWSYSRDNNVWLFHCKFTFSHTCEVLKSNELFVTQISCCFQLFDSIIPNRSRLSVWIDALWAHSCKAAT